MEIIKRINNLSNNYWVSTDKIFFKGNNIYLDFILKNKNVIEKYKVICENIVEYLICDTNGGGLNLWENNNHYMLRQFNDKIYSLKIYYSKNDFDKTIFGLYKLHKKKYLDWISFDKYIVKTLPKKNKSGYIEIYKGPRFIAMDYLKLLKKNGVKYLFENMNNEIIRKNIKMMHFGNSYIIAENIYDKNMNGKYINKSNGA